ncbi:S-adenosyl-L-methionine-dependent methyltransferase [Triangularia verruculosa]|uniref:S-adenosyl-L-methionine-dependent methyltransferase n=1 Tax=Triangularia verruculosa TaxID=2587418 RepID=A0AAN6XKH9_9PEZI|nr:S-adenosyl-L-methionine-dependent methyltransferase [Triangularia verruculosa]
MAGHSHSHFHSHNHGHPHEQSHHHGETQNREYFNQQASTYDSKHQKTLDQLVEEIRKRVGFIGVDWADEETSDEEGGEKDEKKEKREVRLLDYACGTGLVSRALAPYTTQCVGIDLSENMAATYNARAANQGLTPQEMLAHTGNLCLPESSPSYQSQTGLFSAPDFFNFDIAAICLGFHHFDHPDLAAKRLAERLKPGSGVLMILDFLPHEKMDSSHPASETVIHHGFSQEQIHKIFEQAGVGKDFGFEELAVVFNRATETTPKFKRKIFMARGTRAEFNTINSS